MDRALFPKLQQQIDYCFSRAELRALCSKLDIEYDDLSGQKKIHKVTALIRYVDRHMIVARLSQACQRLRPNFAWDEPGAASPKMYSLNELEPLRQKLLAHFDADELKEIVQDLDLASASLPDTSPKTQARELLLYLARRGQISRLLESCARRRPDVSWQNFLAHAGHTSAQMPVPALRIDSADEVNLAKLRQLLLKFDEEALRDVCFTLGVDYDGLEEGPDKTRAIIEYLERRWMIPTLVRACGQQRPDLPWKSILDGSPLHPEIANRSARRSESLERSLQFGQPPVRVGSAWQPSDLQPLLRHLDRRLDMHQLRDLCFDIGVDYITLDGDNKASKIRALIVYLSRRSALDKLAQARPQLFEAPPPDAGGQQPAQPQAQARRPRPSQARASMIDNVNPDNPVQLMQFLKQFSANEIQMLCGDLDIDYDNLMGDTRIAKIRELVSRCQRAGRSAELLQACARL